MKKSKNNTYETIDSLLQEFTENKVGEFDFIVYEFFHQNLGKANGIEFNQPGLSVKDCILKFNKEKYEAIKKFNKTQFDKNAWGESRKKIEKLHTNNFYQNLDYLYKTGYIFTLRERIVIYKEHDQKSKKRKSAKIADDFLESKFIQEESNYQETNVQITKEMNLEMSKFYEYCRTNKNIPIKNFDKHQELIDELSKFIYGTLKGWTNKNSVENKIRLKELLKDIEDSL